MPLSLAYERAVSQYHSLRSEHQLATRFAVREAESYGAVFGPTELDMGFKKEIPALLSWQKSDRLDNEAALLALKRWKTEAVRVGPPTSWSRGQEYVRLWRAGVRPDYTVDVSVKPLVTSPTPATTEGKRLNPNAANTRSKEISS